MILFVTGIGTDVGKTVASAILVEALQADYWKPIQAGDLDQSDSHKIAERITNTKSKIHPNRYALQTPASPHYAAALEGIEILASEMVAPQTDNHLVIEGAGGVLVPINATECVLDIISPSYKVVVVSRHYLGSINHTLLTVQALQLKGCTIAGILFSGNENAATESIILQKTQLPFLGRIEEETHLDASVIAAYAKKFRETLTAL